MRAAARECSDIAERKEAVSRAGAASAAFANPAPPLVVDLDKTLIVTDSLEEALAALVLRKPLMIPGALRAIREGRSQLKAYLGRINAYGPHTLPLREPLVAFLRDQKASGRKIHLVTDANQSVANAISHRLGLFDTAVGSSEHLNLKGPNKLAYLRQQFPDGFSYAGNDASDLDTWRSAETIVIAGASPAIARAAEQLGRPVEHRFANQPATIEDWLRALRVHQWTKNLLMFVPLVLAHRYTSLQALAQVALGFLCMSLVASATYLINDLSDLSSDRAHASKRNRPLARGDITAGQAIAVAGGLGVTGMIGALALSPKFAALLALYVLLTVGYSLRLKAIATLDVFVLGVLYTLRILMGLMLIEASVSLWLVIFSLFFFFSMSMAKRHVEVARALHRGHTGRIRGRGYRGDDAPLTLALGVGSGFAATMVLFLYVVNDAYPIDAYEHPQWLVCIAFLVFLWITRIWLKSHRGKLDDDPVVFALKDPPSWSLGALVVLSFALAIL
jgi:4-hydroxybenzoate polyprenyltransferase